jgi:hypothetical protein
MTAPIRAALYLRVSTSRQADNDLSIPDQRRQARAYCDSHGWQIVADYVEQGASATDDRRPEFQRMIDAATMKPPMFDVILVHSFSRFFRDQFRLEFYVRRLASTPSSPSTTAASAPRAARSPTEPRRWQTTEQPSSRRSASSPRRLWPSTPVSSASLSSPAPVLRAARSSDIPAGRKIDGVAKVAFQSVFSVLAGREQRFASDRRGSSKDAGSIGACSQDAVRQFSVINRSSKLQRAD